MLVKYSTTSVAATAVDFSVFYLLGLSVGNLPDSAAALLSVICGAWVSWTLHRRWVFTHSEVGLRAAGSRYFAGVLLCIALNAVAVALLCDVLGFQRMFGRAMAAVSAWVVVYWFNRRVVFKV